MLAALQVLWGRNRVAHAVRRAIGSP
jgi:hypothetical protein